MIGSQDRTAGMVRPARRDRDRHDASEYKTWNNDELYGSDCPPSQQSADKRSHAR